MPLYCSKYTKRHLPKLTILLRPVFTLYKRTTSWLHWFPYKASTRSTNINRVPLSKWCWKRWVGLYIPVTCTLIAYAMIHWQVHVLGYRFYHRWRYELPETCFGTLLPHYRKHWTLVLWFWNILFHALISRLFSTVSSLLDGHAQTWSSIDMAIGIGWRPIRQGSPYRSSSTTGGSRSQVRCQCMVAFTGFQDST